MKNIKRIISRDENMLRAIVLIWESSVRATHTFLTESDIISLKPDVYDACVSISDLFGYFDNESVLRGFMGVEGDKIEMLFVDDNARGKGIGRALLSYALDYLGAKAVDVNEQNPQAVEFYIHMGFHIIGRSELDGQGRPFPILHMEFK